MTWNWYSCLLKQQGNIISLNKYSQVPCVLIVDHHKIYVSHCGLLVMTPYKVLVGWSFTFPLAFASPVNSWFRVLLRPKIIFVFPRRVHTVFWNGVSSSNERRGLTSTNLVAQNTCCPLTNIRNSLNRRHLEYQCLLLAYATDLCSTKLDNPYSQIWII
jgi:hypothetical protein